MQDHCPIDWSLRSKVRFLSERPFSWCCQMSGAQECAATTAFLKGSDSLISQQLVVCIMLTRFEFNIVLHSTKAS